MSSSRWQAAKCGQNKHRKNSLCWLSLIITEEASFDLLCIQIMTVWVMAELEEEV